MPIILGTFYPNVNEFVEITCPNPKCGVRLLFPIYVLTYWCPKCNDIFKIELKID